ncbi:MAG TPA: DUF305 domain-containing protein [Frateuria sp.]|uniref:DUF305 domain-containing protein n=1 Tax=Frateuria sp. TaxID=2211372 RepID=UPI002D808703|nr:DUF305 domain-containing protein [Frateuria sp.]HET6805057.1 DUF305 domain-containing protein [Frateuria sp.]
MKSTTLMTAAVSMALGVAMSLTVSVWAHGTRASEQEGPSATAQTGDGMAGMHSPGSMELHRITEESKVMPMPMTGDVDKDFATMMTMHHQTAIKMSDALLKYSKNDGLRALASHMKAAQQEDIRKMKPYTK